jgi:flagellar assembly protein FliH
MSSLTEQLIAETYAPYLYQDVRGPAGPPPTRASFEVSATASVPAVLLDAARSEAMAAGFGAGWAQGMREATAQMAEDVRRSREQQQERDADRRAALSGAVRAVDRAAAALEARAVPAAEEIEQTLLSLGIALAEALLQRELELSGTVARDALTRVLRLAPAGEPVLVRLSPADHAALLAEDEQPAVATRQLTLEADPTLSPGDAVAICGVTEIDGRLDTAIARLKAVLAP